MARLAAPLAAQGGSRRAIVASGPAASRLSTWDGGQWRTAATWLLATNDRSRKRYRRHSSFFAPEMCTHFCCGEQREVEVVVAATPHGSRSGALGVCLFMWFIQPPFEAQPTMHLMMEGIREQAESVCQSLPLLRGEEEAEAEAEEGGANEKMAPRTPVSKELLNALSCLMVVEPSGRSLEQMDEWLKAASGGAEGRRR